jgi:hypothetical protein
VLRSDDSGLSWEVAGRGLPEFRDFLAADNGEIVISPDFANDSTAFFVHPPTFAHPNGGLFKTSNRGGNWQPIDFDKPVAPPLLFSAAFANDRIVCVAGAVRYLREEDAQKVKVVGEQESMLMTSKSVILRSTDGGKMFSAVKLPLASLATGLGSITSVTAMSKSSSPDMMFAGTSSGDVLVSINSGAKWKVLVRVLGEVRAITEYGVVGDTTHPGFGRMMILIATSEGIVRVTAAWRGRSVVTYTVGREEGIDVLGASEGNAGHVGVHSLQVVGTSIIAFVDGSETIAKGRYVKTDPENIAWEGRNEAHGIFPNTQNDNWKAAEEWDYIAGCSRAGRIFIGGFTGVYRSDNDGNSWVKLDTISQTITTLAVGFGRKNPTNVLVALCTYTTGCFGGEINTAALRQRLQRSVTVSLRKRNGGVSEDPSLKLSRTWLKPWQNPGESVRQRRYAKVAISPTFDTDHLALRSVASAVKKNGKLTGGMFRSTDYGTTWDEVTLPVLDTVSTEDSMGETNTDTVTYTPHTITFSPNFAVDQTVWVGGRNLGVAVSTDAGLSFSTLWEADGDSTRLFVSPEYGTTKTILVLTETNHKPRANRVDVGSDASGGGSVGVGVAKPTMWISITGGRGVGGGWTPISTESRWDWVAVSEASGDLTVVGLLSKLADRQTVGDLYIYSNKSWSQLAGAYQRARSLRPLGFSRGGVAMAPDFGSSGHLIAGYVQGGALFGTVSVKQRRLVSPNFLQPNPWQSKARKRYLAIKQMMMHSFDGGGSDTSLIQYSPRYAEDGVVFGASFYSLLASIDGKNWVVIYTLKHTSTDCKNAVNCKICSEEKTMNYCIECQDGYGRNADGTCQWK